MSLRTLRAAIDNYDGRSLEPQANETTLLAMMVGTFNALDNHLLAGGRLPAAWRDRTSAPPDVEEAADTPEWRDV